MAVLDGVFGVLRGCYRVAESPATESWRQWAIGVTDKVASVPVQGIRRHVRATLSCSRNSTRAGKSEERVGTMKPSTKYRPAGQFLMNEIFPARCRDDCRPMFAH